ncbi:hypothetical protein CBS101457_004123 [Exobasidium rhododendri]|nr:hypothetical protein CBS101457_004123 [Exobasidium rhododendri]
MPPRTEAGGPSLPKMGSSTAYSIYPTDSVQDVAESIGLPPIRESIAAALAADVEYRLRQVVQDASKFMRHGKRNQLRVSDVDRALKQRNIEPIFGFHPSTLGKSSVSGAYPTAVGSTFRRIQTQTGPIHILADEEIDLEKVLENGPKVALGPGVGWSAHWLAIEGVQPAVPQNPVLRTAAVQPVPVNKIGSTNTPTTVHLHGASAVLASQVGQPGQTVAKPLIKHVLSRELQLYFERLTTAIMDPPREAEVDAAKSNGRGDGGDLNDVDEEDKDVDGDVSMAGDQSHSRAMEEVEAMAKRSSGNTVRDAALASLRGDSGLHQLVPYLIQWVGEKVQNGLRDEKMLEVMLHTINAIVTNPFLGIELYLHQLLPFVISILLTSSLGTSASTLTYVLRTRAGSLLSYIIAKYDSTYPTLRPRLVRTILISLDAGCEDTTQEEEQRDPRDISSLSPFDTETAETGPRESSSTKLGALIGLRRIGTSAIRVLLMQQQKDQLHVPSCHLKRLGNWCQRTDMIEERHAEVEAIVREVMLSLHDLASMTDSAGTETRSDVGKEAMLEAYGAFWMAKVADDPLAKKALEDYMIELRRGEV